jgi:hypothetical protein
MMILATSALLLALQDAELVEHRRIWDQAPHSAFTDLLRFKDRWLCSFREGKGHVSPDGALRVIASADGREWKPLALLTSPTADLRDPKLSLTPDGKLLLVAAAAPHARPKERQSMTWLSEDGEKWTDPKDVADYNFWLWRVTWRKDTAYGFGYDCAKEMGVRLYSTRDGAAFETVAPKAMDAGGPNETSILFLDDGTALCLLRRDGKPNTGQLGTAKAPYRDWTWRDLGVRIGGPHWIRLPDGRFFAVTRRYDGTVRTSLHAVDVEKGALTEILKFPSGGDTSYAGLAWHEGLLWVSYYSSHEGKTSIYLAKVKLPAR